MDVISPAESPPPPEGIEGEEPITPSRRKRTRRPRNQGVLARDEVGGVVGSEERGEGHPHGQEPPPYPLEREDRRGRRRPQFQFETLFKLKNCCDGSATGSIRWFIAVIFLIGVGCSVSGGVLGAGSGSSNREGFTLSLLMIGVGIVLLTVSAIAWKMTSPPEDEEDAELLNCCAILGRRRGSRREPLGLSRYAFDSLPLPNSSSLLSHAPREPPPSYAASMQEYRLRLLLYERSNPSGLLPYYNLPPPPYYLQHGHGQGQRRIIIHPYAHAHGPPPPPPHLPLPYSIPFPYAAHPPPPPLVHPHHHQQPILHTQFPSLSRPPSYRSRSSNTLDEEPIGQQALTSGQQQQHSPRSHSAATTPTTPPLPQVHTRSSSILSDMTTTVVTVLHTHSSEQLDHASNKDNNLITIVQTSDSSQVNCQQGSSVIVTVNSGGGGTMVCGDVEGACYCPTQTEEILARV